MTVFEDAKIPVKVKLAFLWTSTMFCYVYNDFFSLFPPGALKVMVAGRTALGPITQQGLLASALSVALAAVVISLTLALPPRISRWLNIIFATFCTIFVALIALMPKIWMFYLAVSAVEIVLTSLIVWCAWTWPRTKTP